VLATRAGLAELAPTVGDASGPEGPQVPEDGTGEDGAGEGGVAGVDRPLRVGEAAVQRRTQLGEGGGHQSVSRAVTNTPSEARTSFPVLLVVDTVDVYVTDPPRGKEIPLRQE
jgi:hypothetical protein